LLLVDDVWCWTWDPAPKERSLSIGLPPQGRYATNLRPKLCELAFFQRWQFLENSPKLRELAEVARHIRSPDPAAVVTAGLPFISRSIVPHA
jgi:hypothetical protein